jgi:hypothetical protein
MAFRSVQHLIDQHWSERGNMKKSQAEKLLETVSDAQGTNLPPPADVPESFTQVSTDFALNREGAILTGIFLGWGEEKEKTVKRKGEPDTIQKIKTFLVKRTEDGAIVNALISSILDPLISARSPGDYLWIRREKQVQGGQGKVNKFKFAYRLADKASEKALSEYLDGDSEPSETSEQ